MEEILHQLIGGLSHSLQGFNHPFGGAGYLPQYVSHGRSQAESRPPFFEGKARSTNGLCGQWVISILRLIYQVATRLYTSHFPPVIKHGVMENPAIKLTNSNSLDW